MRIPADSLHFSHAGPLPSTAYRRPATGRQPLHPNRLIPHRFWPLAPGNWQLTIPLHPLVYNSVVLSLAHAAMSVATWIFFIGIAGSLAVIIISFAEDLHELFGKD